MEEVHPSLCSQNGDSLQGDTWDEVEFPVVSMPVNEEESCFWSVSYVLCYTEFLGWDEKKFYLCERD